MSKKVVDRLKAQFGAKILETDSFRGDDTVVIARGDWQAVAKFLRDDGECLMDMPVDLTAVDYPDRAQRFEVIFFARSLAKKHRIRMKTRIAEGEKVPTLIEIWEGVNWPEREVFDMFGIEFEGHPDLRRILMYPEFEGYPLRKDYDIAKTQPLVAYRTPPASWGGGEGKFAPFDQTEGQPWTRVDWQERAHGRDIQVSPAIGMQEKQRPTLSKGHEYQAPNPAPADPQE
jgi:NADH-quinone oxidoreductase subunit C